jgi:hypothetical protein
MPNENNKCQSFWTGHNAHWKKINESSHFPRFWAKVDLIGPRAVRVITDKQDQVLFHHDAVELYMYSLIALDGEIKYAPESKLLYVHVELDKYETDAWLVFSLSEAELSKCRSGNEAPTFSSHEVEFKWQEPTQAEE